MNDGVRVAMSRGLSHGEKPIKRIESGDKVRYKNIMLLAPGEWTDAQSRTTLFYAPDAIRRSAKNWIDPRTGDEIEKAPLNHYHEYDKPAENVGHIDVSTVHADDQGRLFADVVFHGKTQRSREMEAMMELSMKEGGQEGLGGISVEIPNDDTTWDDSRNMDRMTEMWFSGAGLVMNPAAATVGFENQSKRAVALSAPSDAERTLFVQSGETTKPGASGQGDMGENETPPAVRQLRNTRDKINETRRALQDPTDVARDALATYLEQEENAREDPITAFMSWVQDAMDPDAAAMVQEAVDGFLDGGPEDEGMDESTVGDFMDWSEGATEPEEPETPEEPEGELQDGEEGGDPTMPPEPPEGGDGVDDATVMEIADTLASVAETVNMAASELEQVTDTAEAVQAENQELREAISKMDRRLADVEDEPDPKTLAGPTGTSGSGDDDGEEPAETTAPAVKRTRDGYLTR